MHELRGKWRMLKVLSIIPRVQELTLKLLNYRMFSFLTGSPYTSCQQITLFRNDYRGWKFNSKIVSLSLAACDVNMAIITS